MRPPRTAGSKRTRSRGIAGRTLGGGPIGRAGRRQAAAEPCTVSARPRLKRIALRDIASRLRRIIIRRSRCTRDSRYRLRIIWLLTRFSKRLGADAMHDVRSDDNVELRPRTRVAIGPERLADDWDIAENR